MADDDGDDVAIGGDADAGSSESEPVGSPGGEFVVSGRAALGRQIDEKTRAAFKAIVEKNRGRVDAEDDDGMDVAISDEPAAAPTDPAKPAPGATPATTPAVAALVPEVVKQHEAANQRQAQLDAREKAIAAREAELEPLRSVRDAYLDDRVGAITVLLKEWGVANDVDLKAELADLITDLSATGLGIQVDPQIRARMDSRRALKKIDAYKAQASVKEKQLAREREELAYSQWQAESTAQLQQEISKPEAIAAFPYLAVEDNAGRVVLDIIIEAHKRDGSTMKWQDAAKLANDYLKQNADAYLAKRRHLIAPASTPGATPGRPSVQPQGGPQVRRSTPQLTNATAAAPQGAPPQPQPGEAGFRMDAHRRATIDRFKQIFATRTDDE